MNLLLLKMLKHKIMLIADPQFHLRLSLPLASLVTARAPNLRSPQGFQVVLALKGPALLMAGVFKRASANNQEIEMIEELECEDVQEVHRDFEFRFIVSYVICANMNLETMQ